MTTFAPHDTLIQILEESLIEIEPNTSKSVIAIKMILFMKFMNFEDERQLEIVERNLDNTDFLFLIDQSLYQDDLLYLIVGDIVCNDFPAV